MDISYLAERPELIPVLAYRLLEERRSMTPDLTLEWRTTFLKTHLSMSTPPIAWVAQEGSQLLGMAALRLHDLKGREDLGPWLAGVYVLPEVRRKGIGTALCRVVEEKAQALGFNELFLFTLDRQRWYEALGWTWHEAITFRELPAVIMHKRLTRDTSDEQAS